MNKIYSEGGILLENLLYITLIGLISGTFGTGIGGLSAFFINRKSKRFLSFLLEFAAGLMTAVVCFDLLPEAFEIGSLKTGIIGIILGVGAIVLADRLLTNLKSLRKHSQKNSLTRAGILLAIGIAVHNFPEGVAVGSGFNASTTLGISLAGVIGLHDIPEGLAMATPLRAGGMRKWKVVIITVLSGLPTGVGALVGGLIGQASSNAVAMCLGFAGGAMLYIVSGELIPESKELHRGRLSTFGNIIGIICGILISFYGN